MECIENIPVARDRRRGQTPDLVQASGRQEPFRAAIGPLCAGLAVLAACSPATKGGGTATVAPTASTPAPTTVAPTTSTTADAWAVPSTITPAYLDRVLAELDHIDGDAFRDARAHNAVTPRFVELEQAIRAGPHELQLQEKGIQQEVQIGWTNIKPVPGDRVMTVENILPAPLPCVLAAVAIDFTPATVGPPLHYPQWYAALVPAAVSDRNPTHWSLVDDGFETDGGAPPPERACAAY